MNIIIDKHAQQKMRRHVDYDVWGFIYATKTNKKRTEAVMSVKADIFDKNAPHTDLNIVDRFSRWDTR